ncbi:hypothetical protein HZF24_02360 [Sedimentibacter hydroxybenzoicus DSM 7310]|uniref:Uncharacterized protein n=1 Tax=Sedimentibacter hydroxybenzoicus DSM 7310 TaxID=1123245 RepID=A0A974BHV9_SEDHY|nr:hypothetical protein [Sedimentibacter hydroxybenzoicus DSM 7310]
MYLTLETEGIYTNIYNRNYLRVAKPFFYYYKDTAGNSYRLDGEGTSSYNSHMETLITVKYPEDGRVILRRTLTPKTPLDKPIRINLPVSN